MTCIVATEEMMAADRCVTADGQVWSVVKIAKNPHLIAAASGNASVCMKVKEAVKKGASSPADLLPLVDDESNCLVLTNQGEIWLIEDGTLWRQPRRYGVGTGADLAMGFIAGACGKKKRVARQVLRAAVEYAGTQRNDCGGGVDVRSF